MTDDQTDLDDGAVACSDCDPTDADDVDGGSSDPIVAADGSGDGSPTAGGAGGARVDDTDGDAEHAVTGAAPLAAAAEERGLRDRALAYWRHQTDWERSIATAVAAYFGLLGLLTAVGVVNPTYLLFLLSLASMYVLLTMGLNVQWGYTGLINFSVAAFFGIGAYGTMLLSSPDSPLFAGGMTPWRWPIVGLLVGVVGGVALAVLIGIPTLSLRDDYLAIATLGLAEVVRLVVLNEREWTDGSAGVLGAPRFVEHWPIVGEFAAAVPEQLFNFLTGAVLVVGVWLFLRRIHRSPWGRVQRLVRTDEDLASALGKDAYRLRMESFVVGSVIMALAGVFYAHLNNAIFPSNLAPILTFDVWIAVILGGTGSNRGAIVGGLAVVTITEGTRFIAGSAIPIDAGPVRLFFVGLLIVVLIRFRSQGLLPPQRELIWPGADPGDRRE